MFPCHLTFHIRLLANSTLYWSVYNTISASVRTLSRGWEFLGLTVNEILLRVILACTTSFSQ